MAIETNLRPFPQQKERGIEVARYLSRHKLCQQWAEEFKAKGQWLRSYSFRNTYSVRAYLRGLPSESVAMAMDHSELTHSTHYVTGTVEATSEVFERNWEKADAAN